MFYTNFLFIKEGPLAKVWLASHMIRKLDAKDIRHANISLSIKAMTDSKTPLALRLCGQLLFGLAKIYEGKVRQTSEEAENVLKKIHAMIGEHHQPRAKRRARADKDDDASVAGALLEEHPDRLRARDGAITAHIPSSSDFGSLGGAFADEDLDAMMDNPEGLVGEELTRALEGMGEAHLELDLDKGVLTKFLDHQGDVSLTQTPHTPLTGAVETPLGANMDDEPLFADEDLGGGEGDLADFMADEARDASVANGRDGGSVADLDLTAASASARHSRKPDPSQDDFELGGGGGIEQDDDARSVARSVVQDLDAQMAEAQAAIADLKRKRREDKMAAKSKRAKSAYVPVFDEYTELSSATLKGWLADTSDIVVSRRPAVHTQRISYASRAIEQMLAKENASLRIPGLRYRPEAIVKDIDALPSPSEVAAAAAARAGAMDESYGALGGDELDLGGGGFGDVFDGPGFTEAQNPFEDEHKRSAEEEDADAAAAAAAEAEQAELDAQAEAADASAEAERAEMFAAMEGSGSQADADAVRVARDLAEFFGESARPGGLTAKESRESVENGWSRRTKKFHAVLAGAFKQARGGKKAEVSLDALLASRARATAAAALYQTLVLASSGFIRPTQQDGMAYSDVKLTKTSTFDGQTPKVPTGSEDTQQSSQEF